MVGCSALEYSNKNYIVLIFRLFIFYLLHKIFNYFMMDLEKILKKNNYKIQSNIFKDYFASHIYQQQQYS